MVNTQVKLLVKSAVYRHYVVFDRFLVVSRSFPVATRRSATGFTGLGPQATRSGQNLVL